MGVYVNSAHRRLLSVPSLKEQLCCLRQYLVHRCNPSLTAVPLKPVAEAELSWSLTPCPSSPPIRLQKHSGFHHSPDHHINCSSWFLARMIFICQPNRGSGTQGTKGEEVLCLFVCLFVSLKALTLILRPSLHVAGSH